MVQIAPGTFCPLIKGECIQSKCMFWTQLRGKHPQTGDPVDEWDCAIKWLPILMIENTKEAMETTASLNSFRNEVVQKQQMITLENMIELTNNPDNPGAAMKEITYAHNDHI